MTRQFPKNVIMQQKGLGDTIGDIVESFNIDLNSNYGSLKTTRMKNVTNSADESDLETAVGFAYYNSNYYLVTDDFVYKGGGDPSTAFTKVTDMNAPNGETSETVSDMELFNSGMYVSGLTDIFKLDVSWSNPITSGLTSSPHLLKAYGDRLYVTEGQTKVLSINTSDVLATSGTSTLDTALDSGEWTITMLEASKDNLWIGLLNYQTGKGRVYSWDGQTTNTPTTIIDLESGVAAGTVLDNIPYIMDFTGRLMAFSGSSFREVSRVFKKERILFDGADDNNNDRYIHPNGMTTTDYGTILIYFGNKLKSDIIEYEDTIPSGVYEYDPRIGIYHKYSISYSPASTTTVTDYGQQRLYQDENPGAILYSPPTRFDSGDNGVMLVGGRYTDPNGDPVYGVFCDDTLDTTQKYSYFITTKQFSSSVQDVWQKIYVIYQKLLSATDSITVKYRTEEDTPTEATITWVSTSSFTTTDDISAYEEGNEVQVVVGAGAGKLSHISTITESGGTYTATLDDTYSGVTGTATVLLSKWIKAGSGISYNDDAQYKALTIDSKNTSPWVQIKVGMQFTGKNEINKLRIINKNNIKE